MGMKMLQPGFRDGAIPLDVTYAQTHPFFGGAPMAMTPTGAQLCTAATRSAYIGLAATSSYEALKNGNITIIGGNSGKVSLMSSSPSQANTNEQGTTVEGPAFDTTVTFANGDTWYVGAAGLITNVEGTAGTGIGKCTKGQQTNDDSVEGYLAFTPLP
jgi:hypothetical protein